MSAPKQTRTWSWVPSLYFAQGIPYVMVMTLSVVMYKRLGISNTDIALYTSWLYLPWVIKPLWSPLVDLTRTKRGWVVSMQFLVSLALALVAFTITGSQFFQWSLFLFYIMAFASATHDIAADGFYMLSLNQHDQAWWVGLRSTFYRTAMIVGSGLLVVLAGSLEGRNGLPSVAVPVQVAATANSPLSGFTELTQPASPGTTATGTSLVVTPPQLTFASGPGTNTAIREQVARIKAWNAAQGFTPSDTPVIAAPPATETRWARLVSGPLQRILATHFPKPAATNTLTAINGNLGLVSLRLAQPPPTGRTVTVNFAQKPVGLEYLGFGKSDHGFRLVTGDHLEFNATNWMGPAWVVVQVDPRLAIGSATTFEASSGNIPLAWQITLFTVAALFLAFSCWHAVMLPRPPTDGPATTQNHFVREFFGTLVSFLKKPGIGPALAFILLYRLDEAQLAKVLSPFMLDNRAAGGLGLSTSQVGLIYGTFGILALTGGGLLGGFLAARYGLKRMLPIMAVCMYLPKGVFLLLSYAQPQNLLFTGLAVALEQFGYGFGFTAFMLYLLYFADGPRKTAHYAIATGLMALGMMIPGMWSGWLADIIGYRHFFAWTLACTLPGLLLACTLKVDPQFGRKQP